MAPNGTDDAGISSTGSGFTDDPEEAEHTEEESPDRTLSQGDRLAALFWLALGGATIGIVLVTVGIQWNLLAPAAILVAYGLFVLWNPEVASTDAPWTGYLWLSLGVVVLIVLQVLDLYWPYEITAIIVGFFMIFAGVLVILDL